MRIFHVALRSEWEAARATGVYDRSTLGRSLAEVGFVHCSEAHQWQRVRDTVFAEVTEPLVLLVVDVDRLDAPVVTETAGDGSDSGPGSAERFPHVYGAIPTSAVVSTTALRGPATPATSDSRTHGRSFSSLLMAEIGVRLALAVAVMVLSGLAGTIAGAALGQPASLVAALAGLAVGGVAAVAAYRRWDGARR